ncbi:hypothetical protein [Kutzneria chonburiensis]|uniref:Uncharacterized protein n=1 Tax=Kutzneria chonburiensis TaxID=1483604 RepID=A0ABV6N3D2_9PSEU|nr:hypothetical protein [Kutzneria chonburiensis]
MAIAETCDFVELICAELGDGWHVDRYPGYLGSFVVKVNGPDSQHVWFRPERGRLEITGHYPDAAKRAYGETCNVRIAVSAAKTPVVIAREIRKRFLPQYEPGLFEVVKQISGREAAAAARRDTVVALKDEFPALTQISYKPDTLDLCHPHSGSIEVAASGNGTFCSEFTVKGASVDMVRRLLAALDGRTVYPTLGE